jgi:hypothetical protein
MKMSNSKKIVEFVSDINCIWNSISLTPDKEVVISDTARQELRVKYATWEIRSKYVNNDHFMQEGASMSSYGYVAATCSSMKVMELENVPLLKPVNAVSNLECSLTGLTNESGYMY